MKTILLPFRDDQFSASALTTAHAVARQYDGHIEGLFVVPEPQYIGGSVAIPGVYLTQMAEDGEKQAAAARQRFDACLQAEGLRQADIDQHDGEPTASWYETSGIEGQVIGERGRLFDLIVIGRGEASVWNIACEAALFDSGRPVLVAAEQAGEGFGDNIVIAWNRSTETARTVAHAMPVLEKAQRVTVIDTPGAAVPGPDGEELAIHLRRHGINASHDTLDCSGGDATGIAILEYAQRQQADLLIKGAYTHTRLRQIVFGGATRHILSNATIPVLLAH